MVVNIWSLLSQLVGLLGLAYRLSLSASKAGETMALSERTHRVGYLILNDVMFYFH